MTSFWDMVADGDDNCDGYIDSDNTDNGDGGDGVDTVQESLAVAPTGTLMFN